MMKEDGDRFLREYDNKSALHAIESSLYGYYSSLKDYSRSGWVSHKINDAESITEHIYNTWLLAFLLLPDSNDYSDLIDDRSYSKDEVLRTILIHDLAERTTGDIERPDKIKNQDQYDFAEHMAMSTGLLLKGTYPGISNMYNDYQRWIAWRDQSTYNAQIAKDLDRIQAIFQLCEYLILQKGDFSPDKVKSWVREYFELRTKVGQRLFVKVILNNPKFDKLELLNIIPELKGIT